MATRKYLLFVDVETSAKPESLKAAITAEEQWPYILQVAWQVYNLQGQLEKTEDHYLYDKSITIDKSSQKIHGLTMDTLHAIGEKRKDVMRKLAHDIRRYRPVIIGHFVELDSKMLQVAMNRAGLKNIITEQPHFCTMMATSEYKIHPGHTYPKLEELYKRLFFQNMDNLHNALGDVEATAKCFFELVKRRDIDPEKLEVSFYSKVKNQVSKKTGCGLPILLLISLMIWLYL